MKNSKKSFILLLLLAFAGQQARADWSWVTGGFGRFFAPLVSHWGKALIGLGAVAGVSAGIPLISYIKNMVIKAKYDRLGAELEVAEKVFEENEKKRKETEKKIKDQQEVLKAKLDAIQSATPENLKQLKAEAEKLNEELVKLGGGCQKELINSQLNARLNVLMSEASQALDSASDVQAIEGYEKRMELFRQLTAEVPVGTVGAAVQDLQNKMVDALSRVCETVVKAEEEKTKGIDLKSNMSDDVVQKHIEELWGDGHDEVFSCVNILKRHKFEEAQKLFGRIGKKLLVYRDLQSKRSGLFGFLQDAIRFRLGNVNDRKAEGLYKKLPLERMVGDIIARQQGVAANSVVGILSFIAENRKQWEEQDSEVFGLLRLTYGEPSRRLALLKNWQEQFGVSYKALKTNVEIAVKPLKGCKTLSDTLDFLKRQEAFCGELRKAVVELTPRSAAPSAPQNQ